MFTEQNFLFFVVFGGILLTTFLISGVSILFFVRPLFKRLEKDRTRLKALAQELGFETTTAYKRVFAFGTYQGNRYVIWGPIVKRAGFSTTHQFIVATRTNIKGKSHVAMMFGKELAERIWQDATPYSETIRTVPSESDLNTIKTLLKK